MNENRLACKLLQPHVEYVWGKIIVKLLENLLYLTAIGIVSQVNIDKEECRSHGWQNNTCSSGKYGVEHFLDTDSKSKLHVDKIQANVYL